MSVRVTTLVWGNGPSNPAQRIVLLCMADYANEDGTGVYPSFTTIAERCALTRRAVINAVNALETAGYVDREHRRNGGRHRSNLYTIRVSKLIDSERHAPSVVHDVHHDSELGSPSVVNLVHHDSEPGSPDPSSDPPSDPPTNPPHEPAAATVRRRKNGATTPATAAADPNLEKREMLARHGLAWNPKTRDLAARDWVNNDYIAAHMAAVQRRGEGVGLAITRMLHGEKPPSANPKGDAAESPATAWQAWQAWQDGDGNGRTSPATLDATTQRMIADFGRDELATWGAEMFADQYELARQNGRRRISPEFQRIIQR